MKGDPPLGGTRWHQHSELIQRQRCIPIHFIQLPLENADRTAKWNIIQRHARQEKTIQMHGKQLFGLLGCAFCDLRCFRPYSPV